MNKVFISVMMGLWVCGALGMEQEDKNSVVSQEADWNRMSLLESVMKLPLDLQKVIIEMIGWPSMPPEKLSLHLPVCDYIDTVAVGKRYLAVAIYAKGPLPGRIMMQQASDSEYSCWNDDYYSSIKVWDMLQKKWQEARIILDSKVGRLWESGSLTIVSSPTGSDDAILSVYSRGINCLSKDCIHSYDIVTGKKITSLSKQDAQKEKLFDINGNGDTKESSIMYDSSESSGGHTFCYVKEIGFAQRHIDFNDDKTLLVTALNSNPSSTISIYDLSNYLDAQKKFMHQIAMAREKEGDKNKNYPRFFDEDAKKEMVPYIVEKK